MVVRFLHDRLFFKRDSTFEDVVNVSVADIFVVVVIVVVSAKSC